MIDETRHTRRDELRNVFEKFLAHRPAANPQAPAGKKQRTIDYSRVSTGPQVVVGHGMTTQPVNSADYIDRQPDWTHVASFSDPGVSGRHDRRQGFQAMQKFIESGQADVLVVDRIDRLHRNLRNLLETIHLLEEHHVQLVSIEEGIDFREPMGQLILVMLGMLAEIYVTKLARETSDGLKTRALEKGLLNGRLPFGLCTGRCSQCKDPNGKGYCPFWGKKDLGSGKVPMAHPVDYPVLQRLFEFYVTGDYTDAKLALEANTWTAPNPDGQGAPIPVRPRCYPQRLRPGDGRFHKDSIRAILTNMAYAGLAPYYGHEPDGRIRRHPLDYGVGQHEAFIPPEVWLRAQEIRSQRGHAPQGGEQRQRSRVYLLTERARCACGRKLRWNNTASGAYGFCPGRREGQCHEPNIRVDRAHQQVAELFAQLCFPEAVVHAAERCLRPSDELHQLERQFQAVEQEFNDVRKAYDQGRADWKALNDAERTYHRIRGQLNLKQVPAQVPPELLAMLRNPAELWERLAPDDQRALVEILIEVAEVQDGKVQEFRMYSPFEEWLAPAGR